MKTAVQSLFLTFLLSGAAYAEVPIIKTPAPVIHLVDNLGEQDQLGWCLDTLGRSFAERLQAHSCKPQGGDVQFFLDAETGLIKSVAFDDYCMVNQPENDTTFGMVTCDEDADEQRFVFDATTKEIRPMASPAQCVVVGSQGRSAGPFMSRDLLLAECSVTDASLKQWVIVE
ncbi:MAG: ricin-type beta-trefoil lectin domain protein [Rhodothermales bacterium]